MFETIDVEVSLLKTRSRLVSGIFNLVTPEPLTVRMRTNLRRKSRLMSDELQPGNKALCSGVYKVIHARQHAESHYVIVLFGGIFPPCLECSQHVRFELAVSTVHVNARPHFARV
jgi:hypothetical protein